MFGFEEKGQTLCIVNVTTNQTQPSSGRLAIRTQCRRKYLGTTLGITIPGISTHITIIKTNALCITCAFTYR